MPSPLLTCRRVVDTFRSLRLSVRPRLRYFAHLATKPLQPQINLSPQPMPQSYGNFDLLNRVKLDFTDVSVSKWRSRQTGLSVVHLDYEAPIVKGYFVVATEIFNDSGCPHTLEHLVFMGSKKYPYKGIIDHLANRGFSNGTNAWTSEDHTCYTVATAGGQGFLQLLPIYVDHILYPTLTASAYTTEVHHIDPSGHDSGVVYSEMQGRENTSMDLMNLRMQQLVYPEGSGYRSEVGGLMEALRALDVQKIRDYHANYYVPHNLTLVVAGKFTEGSESLLSVIQNQIEPSLIARGQNKGPRPPGWVRPFVETASANRTPLQDKADVVEFPEKDESMGELVIVFMGPTQNDYLARKALDVLSTYLATSAVAPLNKEYIETQNPLCTYIYFDEEVRPGFLDLPIYIGSVPTEHLESFPGRLRKSLERIVEEGIDMKRMAMVINRDQRQLRSKLESSKGDTFSTAVIDECVLGPEDGSSLKSALNEMSYYDDLRQWTSGDWASLIKRYYIDSPSVVILGKPSAQLAEKLEKDEKVRIEAQVKRLGPKGLQEAKERLSKAKEENDAPIPEKILKDFPVPDVNSISWITVQSAQEGGKVKSIAIGKTDSSELHKHLESEGSALPFFVQFDHVQSEFITLHALLSMATLPNRLRPLITAYLSSIFSLPITTSSGEWLSHEEVVARLDDETVSYESELGIRGYFEEMFRVSIKVEKEKYETAIRWMKDLIYGADFDVTRLEVTLAKIAQSLPELKRDGNNVLSAFQGDSIYNELSTTRANTVLAQMKAVPELVKQLKENPSQVQKDFAEIRRHLTDPSGMYFSVTGDILSVKSPRGTWQKYFGNLNQEVLHPPRLAEETLSVVGKQPRKKAVVVSLPTIESSFVTHTAKTLQGFKHPEYPALRLALEVLNATESYLWRYIRGSGLAYGASVSCDIEGGLLTFSLYRSSNSLQAFREAAKVVEGLVNGTITLEDTTVDAAKSTIVYNIARDTSTPGSAATMSFVNQALKQVNQNYNRDLLEQYQAVTKGQILQALKDYCLPLFNPESSIAVVVTAPGKVDTTAEGLTSLGFEVERRAVEVDQDELDDEESGSEGSSGSESDSGHNR